MGTGQMGTGQVGSRQVGTRQVGTRQMGGVQLDRLNYLQASLDKRYLLRIVTLNRLGYSDTNIRSLI